MFVLGLFWVLVLSVFPRLVINASLRLVLSTSSSPRLFCSDICMPFLVPALTSSEFQCLANKKKSHRLVLSAIPMVVLRILSKIISAAEWNGGFGKC